MGRNSRCKRDGCTKAAQGSATTTSGLAFCTKKCALEAMKKGQIDEEPMRANAPRPAAYTRGCCDLPGCVKTPQVIMFNPESGEPVERVCRMSHASAGLVSEAQYESLQSTRLNPTLEGVDQSWAEVQRGFGAAMSLLYQLGRKYTLHCPEWAPNEPLCSQPESAYYIFLFNTKFIAANFQFSKKNCIRDAAEEAQGFLYRRTDESKIIQTTDGTSLGHVGLRDRFQFNIDVLYLSPSQWNAGQVERKLHVSFQHAAGTGGHLWQKEGGFSPSETRAMYGVAVLWASDAWSNPELKLRADYASAHADKVKLLKAFAADPKFGPACPMADRWARAKEFGLTPPADVGRMLGLIA